jgi:hypothetical protein
MFNRDHHHHQPRADSMGDAPHAQRQSINKEYRVAEVDETGSGAGGALHALPLRGSMHE